MLTINWVVFITGITFINLFAPDRETVIQFAADSPLKIIKKHSTGDGTL